MIELSDERTTIVGDWSLSCCLHR